jgi:hypothetical protein
LQSISNAKVVKKKMVPHHKSTLKKNSLKPSKNLLVKRERSVSHKPGFSYNSNFKKHEMLKGVDGEEESTFDTAKSYSVK